jgi:hypothetical protein
MNLTANSPANDRNNVDYPLEMMAKYLADNQQFADYPLIMALPVKRIID